ncbi:uncharacterized protein CIMG_13083 [Coccidioides immitis RS]|uniref:Uncharacterized protein n=1 Tax=Coccidioides immitis (strain RS) TaxID=246410 RepID=A0A0D8JTM3_COCIM|nr:uncharacterized protein CIMG_13083 [Coccidioides immitis RS]KJF60627.1 hypothetical protein CIMG_13083 [Coccidioides immitis RS]
MHPSMYIGRLRGRGICALYRFPDKSWIGNYCLKKPRFVHFPFARFLAHLLLRQAVSQGDIEVDRKPPERFAFRPFKNEAGMNPKDKKWAKATPDTPPQMTKCEGACERLITRQRGSPTSRA